MINTLKEAMTERKTSEGFIVTRSQSETIKVSAGKIFVVPAWKFLLELENQ